MRTFSQRGPEDLALPGSGKKEQAECAGFGPAALFKPPHEFLRFFLREIALPQRASFQRGDAGARGLPCGQEAAQHGLLAECLEDRKSSVAGGGGQPAGRETAEPVLHVLAFDSGEFSGAEHRGDMLAQDAFIDAPAPLAHRNVRQIDS